MLQSADIFAPAWMMLIAVLQQIFGEGVVFDLVKTSIRNDI